MVRKSAKYRVVRPTSLILQRAASTPFLYRRLSCSPTTAPAPAPAPALAVRYSYSSTQHCRRYRYYYCHTATHPQSMVSTGTTTTTEAPGPIIIYAIAGSQYVFKVLAALQAPRKKIPHSHPALERCYVHFVPLSDRERVAR